MTERQRRFADEYLIDLNATRAYKAAYPKVKKDETAATAGGLLLRNVQVSAYIQEQMQERQNRVLVTQDQVLEGIMEIAFAKKDEYAPQVRLRALELLGKHLGMFSGKDELDIEEQRARIEKLRSETKAAADDASRVVTVRFVGVADELAE